ncbi:hypothetical protein BDV25DRAFT_172216 [Aspergillus avenaceus]|uniref:SWIM-type domain-containing protein n=1 Tax=Aspergillus avenaceus TaxID=36643 RepID=A0A5N6TCN2_ASPAV|nr:hypothetical protein BDV25DRAFT_172216 [Aspergillus avenaceus]
MELSDTRETLLPSFVQFVEGLISQLSSCTPDPRVEINGRQSPQTLPATDPKSLMLTLHCLFPNELLPALDILDRGLVRRYVEKSHGIRPSVASGTNKPGRLAPRDDIYFVISTPQVPPASSAGCPATISSPVHHGGYEVRLHAWNCSCPNFTLAMFRDQDPDFPENNFEFPLVPEVSTSRTSYPFGGNLTRQLTRPSLPVCKHLLACVLMVRCPELFGSLCSGDSQITIGANEIAGWCAGWGD